MLVKLRYSVVLRTTIDLEVEVPQGEDPVLRDHSPQLPQLARRAITKEEFDIEIEDVGLVQAKRPN